MRRVTKENLIAQIDRLYKIKDEQGQLSMNGEYTLQAYKILLATMEAEPVIVVGDDGGDALSYRRLIQSFEPGTKLYRHAQPAPVVSADLLHAAASAIEDLLTTKDRTGAGVWFDLPFRLRSAANAQPAPVVPEEKPIPNTLSMYAVDAVAAIAEVKGWNHCRASMLNQK